MDLDFSTTALVNAGGALLFCLVGIGILAMARRRRLAVRLGAFASCFGLAYVIENLVDYEHDPVSAALVLVPATAATALLVGLTIELVRDVPPARQRALLGLAGGLTVAIAAAAAVFVVRQVEDPGLVVGVDGARQSLALFPLTWFVAPLLLLPLAASGVAAKAANPSWSSGRLLVGLAVGLFGVYINMVSATSKSLDPGWQGDLLDAASLLLGVMVAATAIFVLRGGPRASPAARWAFAAVVTFGLLGCLQQALVDTEWDEFGAYGVIRTVGAVLLVVAVVKHDVLGVPLPKLVVRRSVVASGALAVVFIVAQVMQNFYSAEYGLLTGGVIAGAILFAASPLQKAFERMGEGKADVPRRSAPALGEAAFRSAVTLAYKDRRFTQGEELALADLAEQLGLGPRRAAEIRHEIEGPSGPRPRRESR